MAIMSSILSSVTRCPLVSGIVSPFGAPMRDGQSVLIRHCYRRALGLEQGMSGITAPDPPAAADLADTSGHAEHYPVVQKSRSSSGVITLHCPPPRRPLGPPPAPATASVRAAAAVSQTAP